MNCLPLSCSNRFAVNAAIASLTLSCFLAVQTRAADQSKSAPAKVEGAVKESELSTITLQPAAEERLGIETVEAVERDVQRTRLFGGEVIIPPGGTVTVTAPLTGRLMVSEIGVPAAGAAISRSQSVFKLWPVLGTDSEILSPSDRLSRLRAKMDIEAAKVEAEGQMARSQVAVEAARLKLDRAQELQERNAGSARAFEEARAEFNSAEATLKAAKSRVEFLSSTAVEPNESQVPALEIQSPIDGEIQQIFSVTNQVVMAGSPLFTISQLDRVWIRVPVYVGEISIIVGDMANVSGTGDSTAKDVSIAKRVQAPTTANANSSTADLYFELENYNRLLRPGQRVMVTLPTNQSAKRLTVPWSAIVFDIQGGTWVYENTQPHVFSRRRVVLERVNAATAVLRRGPKAGTRVVSVGVAELYGTEFGVGK